MTRNLLLLGLCLAFVACNAEAPPETPDAGQRVTTVELAPVWEPETLPVSLMPEPAVKLTALELAILDRAMECDRSVKTPDWELLRDMLLFEREFNVPDAMRGMVLAAACHESGFNPLAEGDHGFSKRGRPVAIGILQQWPWWEGRVYRINRRDPRQAAHAWVAHVHRQMLKVRKPCRLTRERQQTQLWQVAWVTAVRAPAKQPRCSQTPKHYRRLKRWKKSWHHLTVSQGTQIAAR